MADNNTRPREYTIRAEQNFSGVVKGDEVSVTVRDREVLAQYWANITYGTIPLSVQFTDTSLGAPVSWNWLFGDGASSQVQNPIHTYTRSGVY